MKKTQERPKTTYNRAFVPGAKSVLYHYCDTSAFLAIIESGSFRFSDVNMLNDRSEFVYGYYLFERAANDLLIKAKDNPAIEGLDVEFIDYVDQQISPKQLHSHPVVACFSKNPDVLSQWRGYADDSRGWAIGFDAQAVAAMPVTLLEVLYDPDEQLDEVRNFLAAMYMLWRKKGGDLASSIRKDAALLGSFLLAYKNPSFREEQEVRALHELQVTVVSGGLSLVDEGGTAGGKLVDGEIVRYRASGPSVIPYIDIPLQWVDNRCIREVWFGPNNPNGIGNALYPLTHFGHQDVTLERSASSYRR